MATNSLADLFEAAPVHRNISSIDARLFVRRFELLSVQIPAVRTTYYRQRLQKYLLRKPRLSNIAPATKPEDRTLLLNSSPSEQLPSEVLDILKDEGLSPRPYTLELGYDFWTADQILQSILPEELCDASPTSFATVGHIAHLNLRAEYLPYKALIGQVILDKNANITTVVNKLDTINNEFRFFDMEVLAGKPDFIVTLSEANCKFRFDFSKVYWNSRLSTEHERLVSTFKPNEIVADGFAGVGPFAIPAAKRGCAVLANDLNPSSTDALKDNVSLNKVEERVRVWTMDAAAFFRTAVEDAFLRPFPAFTKQAKQKRANTAREAQPTALKPAEIVPSRLIDHFVMNLPATAIEFLGSFRGLYNCMARHDNFESLASSCRPPLIHCYCFTKAPPSEAEIDIFARASKFLGDDIKATADELSCNFVRSVAPAKDMYRLSFRPPLSLLFGPE